MEAPKARAAARVVLVAPYFERPQKDTTVRGLLQEGEVIEVLDTLVDDNGRTKVQHARGWTPAFAPDGRQVLMDLGSGAVHGGENTRLPGAGSRFRCTRPLVPRRGLDRLAAPREGCTLAEGEVLVALELRALSGTERSVRCREGWVDLLAADGSEQLVRVEAADGAEGGQLYADEQERVGQWLAVAGRADAEAVAPRICAQLRADGVPPGDWLARLTAMPPEELARRAAVAAVAEPPPAAAMEGAAALLARGEYGEAAAAFEALLAAHPEGGEEAARGLREARKGERLAQLTPEQLAAHLAAEVAGGGEGAASLSGALGVREAG